MTRAERAARGAGTRSEGRLGRMANARGGAACVGGSVPPGVGFSHGVPRLHWPLQRETGGTWRPEATLAPTSAPTSRKRRECSDCSY